MRLHFKPEGIGEVFNKNRIRSIQIIQTIVDVANNAMGLDSKATC